MIGTLAEVNTVPCICTAAISLGQRVDNWLHCLASIEGYLMHSVIDKSCAND